MKEPMWRDDRKAWIITYKDPTKPKGRQRCRVDGSKIPGPKGKREANKKLTRIEDKFAPVTQGIISRQVFMAAQDDQRTIAELLPEFETHLRGKRTTQTRIERVIHECTVAAKKCRFQVLSDVTYQPFEVFLSGLVDSGRSYNTRNGYRASLIQFMNWALRGKDRKNPLADIGKLNEGADKRRDRRALSPEELSLLIRTTAEQPKGGAMRALYYQVLAQTGLRWSEINRLRRDHLDLEAEAIRLDGSMTKNGKQAEVPLVTALASRLRQEFGMKVGQAKLFGSQPQLKTWKRDLERARIAYIGQATTAADRKARQDGDVLKYKTARGFAYRASLRPTYCTNLYRAGVDLRMARELMRHSDVSLTANVYTKLDELDGKKEAINKLASLELDEKTA